MEIIELNRFFSPEQLLPLRKLWPLFSQLQQPALLESSFFNPQIGRYSILTAQPYAVLKAEQKKVTYKSPEGEKIFTGNPLKVLKEIWPAETLPPDKELRLPFLGGAIGYFSYDLKDSIENLPSLAIDDLKTPLIYLGFYGWSLVADHLKNQVFLVVTEKSSQSPEEIIKNLRGEVKFSLWKNSLQTRKKSFQSNFTRKQYLKAVRKAIDYIFAGDIFQVNLSQRFQADLNSPPFQIYLRLQEINPSPFAAYLEFPDFSLVCCSPERFLLLEPEGKVETRPIKGTRPRSQNPFLDKNLAFELRESPKEMAENLMIVDLERNDLGKVAKIGTVRVEKLFKLESYATVHHLVSIIKAQLREELDQFDLLQATFPGGSITGAPKVRAMEIIEELEPTKRGPYTGALGYLSFSGRMDLNIIIRTVLIKEKTAFFQVGGGIVADSQPDLEYEETLHKGKALFEALGD